MFTLFFALWVSAIVIALGFVVNFHSLLSYSMVRYRTLEPACYMEVKNIYSLAQRLIIGGLKDRDSGNFTLVVGNDTWNVKWEDVGSKLNPNSLKEEDLKRLLENCGLQEGEEMSIILDSFLDWKDKDDRKRLNGAEKEYYENLPSPYKPRNGKLLSVEEMLYIRGMTPEIYRCISPTLSIYGKGKIDINTADEKTLLALGFSEEDVKKIKDRRKEKRFSSIEELASEVSVPEGAGRWLSFKSSGVYRIILINRNKPLKMEFIWDSASKKTLKVM